MEPIKGVGGKRRTKTFPNICLFWVHSSTGELPTPKSTQDVRANFTHLQVSQAWSLGLGMGNSAHSSNLTYLFFQNCPSRTLDWQLQYSSIYAWPGYVPARKWAEIAEKLHFLVNTHNRSWQGHPQKIPSYPSTRSHFAASNLDAIAA